MPRFAIATAFLLGALTATAWLMRAVEHIWPCEQEHEAVYRVRGDCG